MNNETKTPNTRITYLDGHTDEVCVTMWQRCQAETHAKAKGWGSALDAVVKLNAGHGIALPDAMGMVTWKVADILGLKDRGHLKEGLRADLLRFKVLGSTPVLGAVWSRGERAF